MEVSVWNTCWIWEPSTDLLRYMYVIDRASEHHLESGITSLLSCTLCFCDFISHHTPSSVQYFRYNLNLLTMFPKLGAALPVSQLGGLALKQVAGITLIIA